MEDYGLVSLNGEKALVVRSKTVGELAPNLQRVTSLPHIFIYHNITHIYHNIPFIWDDIDFRYIYLGKMLGVETDFLPSRVKKGGSKEKNFFRGVWGVILERPVIKSIFEEKKKHLFLNQHLL